MTAGRASSLPLSRAAEELFQHGGELGERMRAIDWSGTPLGPVARWPHSLKACVRIVLTSRQPMFVWWGDSLINLYNDAYKSIVGGKHPEALGQPASTVWREIWDQVGPRAAAAMHGNQGTYDEALLLVMERYGYEEETYYTFSYSPVPNDDGTTGGLICANTDDTRRVIGERQLATLRELAARAVDVHNIGEACSRAAEILHCNPRDLPFAAIYLLDPESRAMSLAGVTGAQPGSDAAPTTVDSSDAGGPFAAALRTHETQVTSDLRRFGVLPSGAWPKPPREIAFLPILASGPSGRAGVLVVGLNPFRQLDDDYRVFLGLVAGQISASIAGAAAYDAEKKRVAALAEIDRAKTAFFSNVSHEFRTPLTLMLGPTEDALASPERALRGEELETVHRNELRLLKLVNALLDFSRIEAGRVKACYEATDLGALTGDLVSAFRSAIERAGLAFEVDCPALSEPTYVDHDMWEKIVLNLLSNALKFTFEGRISVALREDSGRVELTVRDTGVGIAESELPRLFERFQRIEGARARTHEGSGIGLALVRDLVGLHGGTIDVASKPGEGTTFTVAIPSGTAHLPPERIGSARSLSSTSARAVYAEEALRWMSPAGGGGESPDADSEKTVARILVADDNTDMRDYIARILRRHWSVECVSDGVEALLAVRRRPPDLVLSDVMMPRLDGIALVRELRGDPATAAMPVILLSARAGEDATAAGLRTGADDYLVKPFSASALVVRVEAQLAAARLRETQRRSAEAERERLKMMFREAPAGIAVLRGQDFVIEVANPLMLRFWGKTPSIVGQPLFSALPELAGQGVHDLLAGVLATGVPCHRKDVLARLDRRGAGRAEDAYFDLVYVPLHAPEGGIDGIFVHAHDVTEKVNALRHAEQLRVDAERAVRAREQVLAIVSHDLRNPLSTVLIGAAHIERMADGSDAGTRTRKAAGSIVRAANRMSRLIGDLLDLAKLEAGQPLPLDMGTYDVVQLTQQAVELLEPLARSRQLTLTSAVTAPLSVVCDSDRVEQALTNLIGNAIKFTREGGTIELRAARSGGEVVVSVHDTGTGIPDHQMPHIFEPYWQADSQRKGGAGLGLSIVKAIVEAHGGRIWVETSPDQGSTFSFTLSAADAAPTATGER